LFYNQVFIYIYDKNKFYTTIWLIVQVKCVSLPLIVTRKRGDGRYYFALWQTNNNTPNTLLLSESAVSCLLRVRSVSFTSRAKGCIKFVPHSCLVSLSHKVGVFLEEAICYFIYSKFAVMLRLSINTIVLNHVNSDHVPSFSCLDVWISRQTTSGVYAITVTSAYHSRRCGRL
jgi:hypothetical protein